MCGSGTGVVSFFFKNTGKANPFFDWQTTTDTYSVDLSLLAAKDMALNNLISGYIGSDTVPTCTSLVCWYLVDAALDISTA
jgi:hypothetical protein